MIARFEVLEDGSLMSDSGRVIGRIVALEIELANSDLLGKPLRKGALDVDVVPHPTRTSTSTSTPMSNGATSILSASTDAVWEHYVETFNARRQELNVQRRRIIEKALERHTVEECCQAITGLSRSPHHNGQNEQRIKYLDIRYALKGNGARGESNDERIAKMAQLASLPALETEAEANANERQRRLDSELAKLEQFPDSELRPGDIARRDELRAQRAELGLA